MSLWEAVSKRIEHSADSSPLFRPIRSGSPSHVNLHEMGWRPPMVGALLDECRPGARYCVLPPEYIADTSRISRVSDREPVSMRLTDHQ